MALISVQYGILVFTVLYLHETLEIGIGMAATLLFVAQGSGVAGRILLAAWSDRCRAGRYFPGDGLPRRGDPSACWRWSCCPCNHRWGWAW